MMSSSIRDDIGHLIAAILYCTLFFHCIDFFFLFVSSGKVFIGNKKEIAESRIPELNIYMKVITFNAGLGAEFNLEQREELLACSLSSAACSSLAYSLVG